MKTFLALALLFLPLFVRAADSASPEKSRLVVLTDVGADPDDSMSLVRLLLYSNEIDLEGIVATTSTWKRSSVSPELIHKIIDAYEKVRPNLLLHSPGYPEAGTLKVFVKRGLPKYGMEGVGEDCDSEGSEWLMRLVERHDPRPLWISVWGGSNTLAQTLYRLRKTKTPEELERLVAKLRVYAISDQDDSGPWLRREFPNLFYIASPGDDYGKATWIAINSKIEGIDNTSISNAWLARNIQQGRGPLGLQYPDVAYGMEGDSPAFLGLIPNGLNVPERPDWGGWGGRYEKRQHAPVPEGLGSSGVKLSPETRPFWTDTRDAYRPHLPGEYGRSVQRHEKTFTGNQVTLWRWRDAFQNDFAARMLWCVRPYAAANHPPEPVLQGSEELVVKSGEKFSLDASASTDPDGDSLSFLWLEYPELSENCQSVKIDSADNAALAWFKAPQVEKEARAQVILAVTDKGTPALTRYKRIFVRILP